MARLSPILRTDDFSATELAALRLDGSVYALGDSYCVVDEVSDVRLRATSLSPILAPRLIVARLSAAWIWGAVPIAPHPPQVCAAAHARRRPTPAAWVSVHETVITAQDIVTVVGVDVTSPMRTAIDLARFCTDFGEPERECAALLMGLGAFTAIDCIDDMNRGRNLPNKLRAATRLIASERLLSGGWGRELPGANAIHVVDRVDPTDGIQHSIKVSSIPHLEDEPAERKSVA